MKILKDQSSFIKIIELAIGCLHCCCTNVHLIQELVEAKVADEIIRCCRTVIKNFGHSTMGDTKRGVTMICYTGFNAVASMCLHAETKCWIDEPQSVAHSIRHFVEKKEEILSDIATWLHEHQHGEVVSLSMVR